MEMEGRLPQEVVELCLQEEEEGVEDCPQLEAEVVVPQQEGGIPVRVEEEGGEVYEAPPEEEEEVLHPPCRPGSCRMSTK